MQCGSTEDVKYRIYLELDIQMKYEVEKLTQGRKKLQKKN